MESRQYYRALTRNMVLTMILVSISPLILITGIIGYGFETSYREKVIDHLKELVQKHQQNIDGFLSDKLSYIQVLANSYTYEQLSDEEFLKNKLAILQHSYGGVFVDLGLVNDQGVQISYAGSFELVKANYSDAEWFKQAIHKDFYISDVFLGLRRQPHFIVAVKRNREGSDWILRATIDFVAFNSLVESIRIGETGSAFILNRQGEYQTKPRQEPAPNKDFFIKFLARSPVVDSMSVTGSEGFVQPAEVPNDNREGLTGSRVISGTFEYRNRSFVYVTTALKDGEWMLAYQQDWNDAFADLCRARRLAVVIFLFGSLGIVLVALVLSKKTVRHIEKADREKEMMNEQVIETGKLASVGELAAGIAHEINNPIAIMVEEAGWIEDLLEESEFGESANLTEFKRALQQINTQGIRCKEITHKLLSFARKTDPKVQEVQLNDLVEEIVSISEQRARYSNVRISSNLLADLPHVMASPSELQQVFLNLINNAIDAIGSEGGTIDINTRVEGGFVVVDVADTGYGIPKAIMARMFEPFFTTKPVGKGTGLGLSICYGIIKKMNGEITVNSAVGVGTTFHIHIPLASGAGGSEGAESARETIHYGGSEADKYQ